MQQINTPKLPRSATEAVSDDAIDIGSLLRTLWIGKWIIAASVGIAIFLGGYYAYIVAEPTYRAQAVLILNSREDQLLDIEGVMGGLSGDTTVINSELEVLRSRSLIGKVVDQIGLIEDPEFNRTLQTPSLIVRIETGAKDFAKGLLGVNDTVPAERNWGALTLPEVSPEERERQATIDALMQAVTAGNVRQSLVFEVGVETSSARKSALIANTIAETYVLDQIEVKFQSTEQATSWLTGRVAELQTALEAAEGRVKAFRAETALVSAEALVQREIQLKDLRDRIASAEAMIATGQDQLTRMRAADTPEDQARATDDPQLLQLLTRLDQPGIADAFESRFAQQLLRTELALTRNRDQLMSLTASRDALAQEISDQSEDLIQLEQLEREAEASRLLYEYFLGRLKETSAQEGIHQADSRVLSQAVVPLNPATPRKGFILMVSVLLGFLAGAAVVLLRSATQNTVRNARELSELVGADVSGQVPLIPSRRRKDVMAYLRENPTSAAAEAMRNLRTSILLRNIDTPFKTLMVTSSIPGEGKSTISFALAQHLSDLGKRVCFIEGDLRRRILTQYFDVDGKNGLISVLEGNVGIEEAVWHSAELGADILVADQITSNAADILSSQRFAALLEELKTRYDHVIIDTPPVLVVPDARIVAQHVDSAVYVVRWDHTQKAQIEAGLQEIRSISHPPIEIVLNQINARKIRQYGHGGNYGAYATYGSKYYNT